MGEGGSASGDGGGAASVAAAPPCSWAPRRRRQLETPQGGRDPWLHVRAGAWTYTSARISFLRQTNM